METDDLIVLPASSNSDGETRNEAISNPGFEHIDIGTDNLGNEAGEILLTADTSSNLNSTSLDVNSGMDEAMTIAENVELACNIMQTKNVKENGELDLSESHIENGCRTPKEGGRKKDGRAISYEEGEESNISSAKKAKIVEPQPSVNVTYNSLARKSKEKLEELLQEWSQWHIQNCSSLLDSDELLESGDQTFFPALRVTLDNKPSGVSYWVDNQSTTPQSKELYQINNDSVPLYDREYSLALNSSDGFGNLEMKLDAVDSSRCFNCASYGHSLKDCPKPRNNAAVNSARKQHKVKRNVNASSRNPSRYYQNSAGGKYDGLRPGVLSADTRKLLCLGELDPPPWLRRMRELGYPPGYLDPDVDDEPSGIIIFGDDEKIKEETEDGEILDKDSGFTAEPPPKKMSVEFPGMNSPIPDNADEWKWGANFNLSRSHSYEQRGGGHEYQERRWSRNNLGGDDPKSNQIHSRSNSYRGRGYNYDNSPSDGRSFLERSRWSPSSAHEDKEKEEEEEEEGELQSPKQHSPSRRKTATTTQYDYMDRDDEKWNNRSESRRNDRYDGHHNRRRW